MESPRTGIMFVDARHQTAENTALIELAEERARAPRSEDRDLDVLIAAVGFKPSDFSSS